METFIKVFIIFWLVWILWYVTGGPLRDSKSPFVKVTEDGIIQE